MGVNHDDITVHMASGRKKYIDFLTPLQLNLGRLHILGVTQSLATGPLSTCFQADYLREAVSWFLQ